MAEDFRQMKKKVIEILIAISFIVLCIVLIVRFLATPINSVDPRKLSNADMKEIQRVKAAAEMWQWEELLKEAKFEVKKYDYKISRIPQTAFFWSVAAWSALGACIFSVLILVTFSGITGKQLMTANPDAVVLALMTVFPKSKEHYNFLRESKRTERAALQLSPQQELEIINADRPINIALPLVVPPASKCLEMGLISQNGDRFLYGFDVDTGEPHFGNLKESKSDIAIIGGKQRGKTWNAVNIAVQHFYKGAQGIVIDIHSRNEKSFTSYLADWKENPSIKWCEDRNQVPETLQFIVAEIDRRLKLKTYEHRLIIVADECLQLAQIAPDLFRESILRVVTEGDKIGMNFIGISHSWQGKRQANELRDNIFIGISHFAKPGQSNMLFKDGDVAKMTESLKDGEFVMRDEKTEVHRLSVPVWDSTTLKRMADSAPVHPLVIEELPQQAPASVAILAEHRNRQQNTW
jgi:hypothetical protein